MPKNNPYYIPKLPETATISYFDESEWNKDLTPEELKQQEALEASYIAEWEEWGKIAGYGPGFGSWLAKVAIVTVAGPILGPAAIPVGLAVWGGGKVAAVVADEVFESEDAKKVFEFVSDCGVGTFTGGVIGAAAKGVGAVAGFEKVAGLGKNCGTCIASAKHGIKVAGTIEFWTGKGFEVKDALKHMKHWLDGINYETGCVICETE